jgi:hypothetical protein
MRTRFFLKAACVAALAILWIAGAQADPAKSPKRMINGQTVDLSPLFRWWTDHNGARPLTAWVHLTGTVVATNAYGWVIRGTVETVRPGATNSEPSAVPISVVLKNPPVEDMTEFEQLSDQAKTLKAEKDNLSAQAGAAAERSEGIAQQQQGMGQQGKAYRQMSGERQALNQQENQASDQAKDLDEQLRQVQLRLASYPNPNNYVLDCVALSTGLAVSGMLLYDHGAVSN